MDRNRKAAYRTLLRVEKDSAYSNLELNRQIEKAGVDSPAFVRELTYGTIKRRYYLDYLLRQLVTRGYGQLKPQVQVLLWMGAYQILFMDSVPEYAAVDGCMKLAEKECYPKKGFINAVLRNLIRKKDRLRRPEDEKDVRKRLSVVYSVHPDIAELLIDQKGEQKAEEILSSMQEAPGLYIAVNSLKTDEKSLQSELTEAGFQTERFQPRREFRTEPAIPMLSVKGSGLMKTDAFKKGRFYVQDPASMIAVSALQLKGGEKVIDVCGAPGGKSVDAAVIAGGDADVLTFDYYEKKIELIQALARRLRLNCIHAMRRDATSEAGEYEQSADAVICDVPCSGLGVLRRKPEIRYKKVLGEMDELIEKQRLILEQSSRMVKPGGRLMYSTCTINDLENKGVVSSFTEAHGDEFSVVDEQELLPASDGTDGFYFSILRRKSK